jgi:hypothetical protein
LPNTAVSRPLERSEFTWIHDTIESQSNRMAEYTVPWPFFWIPSASQDHLYLLFRRDHQLYMGRDI